MTDRVIEPAIPANSHRAGGCLAPMVFAVFLIAGVVIVYSVFWEALWGTFEASRWIRTPCMITSSRIEVVRPGGKDAPEIGGTRYVPEVRYAYRFGGTLCFATRIWFIRPAFDTLHEAEEVIERYPRGRETVCYVDPKQPGSAVLERGFKPALLIALVPLGLALTGLIGLAATMGPSVLPAYWMERWQRWRDRGEAPDRQRGRRRVYAPGGPFSFQPHHDGTAIGFFFVFFAIVWNGLMIFLVQEVIDSWQAGIPGCYGLSLTLFAVPLVLVGLGALIPPIYWALKLFNPRLVLRLSAVRIELGGEVRVRWRVWGNAGRIRRLRVFVEGREEATYTRGTHTFTDYEVFVIIPLADTDDPGVIRSGQACLTIPLDAVPTFHSRHNKVIWALRIHGQTGPWPDVDEEFELEVVPSVTRAASATQ